MNNLTGEISEKAVGYSGEVGVWQVKLIYNQYG